MNIYGEKVVLRAIEYDDIEMLRETTNDPNTERMIGGWSFPISKENQKKWYDAITNDSNNLRFVIQTLDSNEAIGMVNLVNIDWKNRSAFHGIRLCPNAPKRRGYGTDAVLALMRYAFEELQLVRLDGSWVENNESSIHLYEKLGWKIEGKKSKAKFTRGKYYDVYFGGILKDEYYSIKRTLNWIPYDEK